MNTRLTTTSEVRSLLLVAIVALALLMALGATPTSAASSSSCRVQNTMTGKAHKTLQAAVDAAKRGDRLTVRGTCRGRTIIDTDLVIEGPRRRAMPRLDGGMTQRVLRVRTHATVIVRRLIVERGQARKGGGIWNQGTLTLRDVIVRHNRATDFGLGGGVANDGTLVLWGRSAITANTALGVGHSEGHPQPSGGGVYNVGTLTLHDRSAIRRNTVLGRCIEGTAGGLDISGGPVTLDDHSVISGNRIVYRCATPGWAPEAWGGGVAQGEGSLTLNGSSHISRNRIVARVAPGDVRPFGFGGGVYRYNGGPLTLNDHSVISHNRALMAGGVDARGALMRWGTLTMTGSSAIFGNIAAKHGGGILHHRRSQLTGVICGPGAAANVRQNRPEDCHVMVGKG